MRLDSRFQNPKSKIQNPKLWKILLLNFAFFTFQFALYNSVAFAAEGGEHGGGSAMEWVWRLLNFGVLVFLLVKFAGKPLKEYLQQRKELIAQSIKEAREAKELAKRALAEVEERLKLKDKEIEDIISSARNSGEKEKERLIDEGERLRLKILEHAKVNIDYEVKRAKDAIRDEAVDAAMQLAEEKIKGKLTAEDQERLLKESLKQIEGKN